MFEGSVYFCVPDPDMMISGGRRVGILLLQDPNCEIRSFRMQNQKIGMI
jgi:hypothetical protein